MRAGAGLRGLATGLASVALLAACEGQVRDIVGLGRRVVPNDWVLLGISPDERVLRVSTFYGGEASGCNRWVGAEVDERAERVSVRMLLSKLVVPRACTDEGITRTATVRLDAPLGDRPLVGCGSDPSVCRATARDGRAGPVEPPWRHVEVAAGLVVLSDEAGLAALDAATGEVRWTRGPMRPHSAPELLWVDELVGVQGPEGGVVAFDTATGRERWRLSDPGIGAVVAPSSAEADWLLFHTDATGALVARDRSSGDARWRVPAGDGRPTRLAVGAETVAVLLEPEDWQGPASTTIAAFAMDDGRELWRHTVPERLHSVAVADDTVLTSGSVVRHGWEAGTGNLRWRVPPFAEHAVVHRTAQGPGALVHDALVLFDARSSYEHRRVALAHALSGTANFHENRVLLSTRDGHAEVRALDGGVLLRVPLGGAGGRPAAGEGIVAVPTHLGVSVFGEDGVLRWWSLREPPEDTAD